MFPICSLLPTLCLWGRESLKRDLAAKPLAATFSCPAFASVPFDKAAQFLAQQGTRRHGLVAPHEFGVKLGYVLCHAQRRARPVPLHQFGMLLGNAQPPLDLRAKPAQQRLLAAVARAARLVADPGSLVPARFRCAATAIGCRVGMIEKLALYEPPFIIDDSRPPVPPDYVPHLNELLAAGRRSAA
jgi:hypothetical protein